MASGSPLTKKHVAIDYRHPICGGYLFKQNKIGNFFTKRYFALYPKYLVYYANEADYKKDKDLNTLEHRHGAYNLEGVYLSHCRKKPDGAKYCFNMHLPAKCNSRHEILLNCHSQADRKVWMEKLQTQNSKLVSHGHGHQPNQGDAHHSHQPSQGDTHHGHQPSQGDAHHSHQPSQGDAHHGHQPSQGNGHLSIPNTRGHKRQVSFGGEGELNVQDVDSDEEHPTECEA